MFLDINIKGIVIITTKKNEYFKFIKMNNNQISINLHYNDIQSFNLNIHCHKICVFVIYLIFMISIIICDLYFGLT